MAWFRRRSTSSTPEPIGPTPVAAQPGPPQDRPSLDLVPMVSGQSLERTERALKMLATQSAQLHGQVVHLERRVDALSDALLDRLDVPSNDDLLEARMHSAKVAAELSRLEVNLAARLDAVRDELRAVQGQGGSIDLRELTPNDTGWAPARSSAS
ncbi:MAG TPA: hypothetical protein VGE43_04710 [Acidimicrobiales bacterium]|jgi:hypothetical protein